MDLKHLHRIGRTCAGASLLAFAAVHAPAAEPSVIWVDNESFGFTNCAPVDT